MLKVVKRRSVLNKSKYSQLNLEIYELECQEFFLGFEMGGEHHHGPPYTVPDYRIYKVSDVPLLVKTERALAAKGLKDPWLRNEVWRYDPKYFGTEPLRMKKLFLRGFKYGFVAFVATVVGTEIYDRTIGGGKHGDHGHGHH